MKNLEIPASIIKAARECQATDDVRHYLCGIHLNKEKQRIEATNGHILFTCDFDLGDLPKSVLFTVPKGTLGNRMVSISIDEYEKIHFAFNDTVYLIEPIDANFPDIDSLIPNDYQQWAGAQYNVDTSYLAKTLKIFGKGGVSVYSHPEEISIIFYGVIDFHPAIYFVAKKGER